MYPLLLASLTLVLAVPALAEDAQFSKVLKASLEFRADSHSARHYPHLLKVFLRLENTSDADVSWVTNPCTDVEAELLDAAGNAVAQAPQAASIASNPAAYLLPFGSRLDWLISHGGISMLAESRDHYALMVGGRGWLIPIKTADAYSLRIRLRGSPWARTAERSEKSGPLPLLLDLPPAKVNLAP